MTLYRSHRLSGFLGLGCALPFLVFMAAILWVRGLHFFVFPLACFGGITIWAGLGTIATVISSNDRGLQRAPRWWRGTSFSWDDVESWCVVTDEFDHTRKARFRIRGRWVPTEVQDVDVFRPGFDIFLRDLRNRVGLKETPEICSPCRQ